MLGFCVRARVFLYGRYMLRINVDSWVWPWKDRRIVQAEQREKREEERGSLGARHELGLFFQLRIWDGFGIDINGPLFGKVV